MIAAVSTAKTLDWGGWLLGAWGALISGGAGAISSGFGVGLVDPDHFNLTGGGFHRMLAVMAVTFLFSAIVSLAKFLQTHPVPQPVSAAPQA